MRLHRFVLPGCLAIAACGDDNGLVSGNGAAKGGSSAQGGASSGQAGASSSAGGSASSAAGSAQTGQKLTVTSSAFQDGLSLPVSATCDGEGELPPLSWTAGPAGTRSYVITVRDPDVPDGDKRLTLEHWVAFFIPPEVTSLGANASKLGLPAGAKQANAFYAACPPPMDIVHHYHFDVFALDTVVDSCCTPDKPWLEQIDGKMAGHVLAQGRLTGVYGKGVSGAGGASGAGGSPGVGGSPGAGGTSSSGGPVPMACGACASSPCSAELGACAGDQQCQSCIYIDTSMAACATNEAFKALAACACNSCAADCAVACK